MKTHNTSLLVLALTLYLINPGSTFASDLVLTSENTSVTLAMTSPGAGDGLVDDAEAFGGKFATNSRPYHPVVRVKLPEGWESAQVWVRQRGGPFQLKGNGGGSEILWVWVAPDTWTWVSYETHTRSALTENFLFIRSDSLAPDGGIDAVVLISEDRRPRQSELNRVTGMAAAQINNP